MKNEIDAKIASCKAMIERLSLQIEECIQERALIEDYMEACACAYDLFERTVEPVDNPHNHFLKLKLRTDSYAFKVRNILLDARKPMHINDICNKLFDDKEIAIKKRSQLRGNLEGLCQQLRVFVRVAPATYGLMEWEKLNG